MLDKKTKIIFPLNTNNKRFCSNILSFGRITCNSLTTENGYKHPRPFFYQVNNWQSLINILAVAVDSPPTISFMISYKFDKSQPNETVFNYSYQFLTPAKQKTVQNQCELHGDISVENFTVNNHRLSNRSKSFRSSFHSTLKKIILSMRIRNKTI